MLRALHDPVFVFFSRLRRCVCVCNRCAMVNRCFPNFMSERSTTERWNQLISTRDKCVSGFSCVFRSVFIFRFVGIVQHAHLKMNVKRFINFKCRFVSTRTTSISKFSPIRRVAPVGTKRMRMEKKTFPRVAVAAGTFCACNFSAKTSATLFERAITINFQIESNAFRPSLGQIVQEKMV